MLFLFQSGRGQRLSEVDKIISRELHEQKPRDLKNNVTGNSNSKGREVISGSSIPYPAQQGIRRYSS